MGRTIPLPVPILPILPWNRFLQRHRHIPPDIWVRPLLNGYPSRRVGNYHLEQPIPPPPTPRRLLQDLC